MKSMDDVDPAALERLSEVQTLLAKHAVALIDALRLLPEVAAEIPTYLLAPRLNRSEQEVEALIAQAASLADAPKGFSGADPYEIAQRYASGQLTRDQVIDELSRWPYVPSESHGWEGYTSGTWEKFVIPAHRSGLIDDDVYTAALNRDDR